MRARLLLVDDTYANLVALTGILESLDQELVTARSGEEALRKLLDADFAVILLDVRMPGLDGFQTAALIRQRERSRKTPIIFLTAHESDPKRVFDGYAHGAVDYLVKPYDPDALRAKVRVLVELHLSRERVRDEAESARRRDRQSLETSSAARQQRLLDAVPHPIWIARANTTIETANRAWMEQVADVTGSASAGFLGIVDPIDRDEVERRWRIAVGVEETFTVECRLQLRKRGAVWHAIRCVPERDPGGRVTSWVCTATEIDELRAVEESRDELRAILADVVRPRIAALWAAAKDGAHDVDACATLLAFVEGVIAPPSTSATKPASFDLAERLKGWCEAAQAGVHARRIEARFDGPMVIEGNVEEVERAVLHLLAAAMGRTTTTGEPVEVRISEDATHASIVIRDGAPAASTRPPLRLARQLAERCGGRLSLESDAPQGTTTVLELPRRRLADTVPAFRSATRVAE